MREEWGLCQHSNACRTRLRHTCMPVILHRVLAMNFAYRLPGPYIILDSSFNPPTIAHRAILLAAKANGLNKLLLLGTLNADKAALPASFPHRKEMMLLLAKSLGNSESPGAAVALIDQPTFAAKASSDAALKGATWVMGWDTLVRFFAERYYPDGSMRNVLRTFFIENRSKVVLGKEMLSAE